MIKFGREDFGVRRLESERALRPLGLSPRAARGLIQTAFLALSACSHKFATQFDS
jgi:hypothetical protein